MWQSIKILQIQNGGRPPYWKSSFGYISANYCPVRLTRNFFCEEAKSRSDTGPMTKIPNFENSRWQTAAILKMVLSVYLSRESSDFDEIWCADSNFGSKNGHMLIYKKNMKFKMADSRHIESRILAISPQVIVRLTRYLVCTSRTMLRHMPRDENSNFRKFKTADGRHFENGFITISQPRIIRFQWNLVCHCRFWF